MQMMGKKEIDAATYLGKSIRTAESFAFAGAAYQEKLANEPRVAPEIGAFYLTLDGSTVLIARRRTQCTCPVCSGLAVSGIDAIRQILGIEAVTPREPAAHQEDPAPSAFWACVIRGGHGQAAMSGEKPGERYVVDGDGLVLMDDHEDPSLGGIILAAQLSMVGLCLARRLDVAFEVRKAAVAQTER